MTLSCNFPDEPSVPEIMECPGCDGVGSYYGMAPHTHTMKGHVWKTDVNPRPEWPKNFHEDPECPGLGVWVCETCDGNGKVENPIAMVDQPETEFELDPWPHGGVVFLEGQKHD